MADIATRMKLLKEKDYLLRPVAIETIANMKDRIHEKGQGSDQAQIGTYSSEYMRLRTGTYINSGVYKSGKRKGETKDSGAFTRGAKKGQARPKYNRSVDTKVIVSLTRQLENDWSVLATETGYGIGFNNPLNTKKAGWVEKVKNRVIFKLTETEMKYIVDRLNQLTNNALNS